MARFPQICDNPFRHYSNCCHEKFPGRKICQAFFKKICASGQGPERWLGRKPSGLRPGRGTKFNRKREGVVVLPSCVSHFLLGRQVLENLPDGLRDEMDRDAYFWGVQGPDFLFCHQIFPWMKKPSISEYGTKFHSMNPDTMLSAVQGLLHAHPENKLLHSYVLGFLCHYALDSVGHPLVNTLAKKMALEDPVQTQETMHAEIESALDVILLRKFTGKLPTQVKLHRFFPKSPAVQQEIAELYHQLIEQLFQEIVTVEQLLQSTRDAQLVFRLLTDSSTMKRRILERLERNKPHVLSSHILPLVEKEDVDYANLQALPWIGQDGVESTDHFFDRFQQAKQLAETLILNFDHCALSSITKKTAMNGVRYVNDRD